MDDMQVIQTPQEKFLLAGIFRKESVIVILSEIQAGNDCLLQRSGCSHSQEVVDLSRAVDDPGRCDNISEAPPRNGVGLGQGGAGKGPLPHARQRRKVGVSPGGVDDMLIDLVRDDIDVIFCRETGDDLQFFPGEHLAAGI